MTVVVATHDAALAARCDRVIRLRDGAIRDDVLVEQNGQDAVLDRIARLRADY